MGWSNEGDDERVLIYDLRQAYAEIISTILKQIVIARQQNNFIAWYNLLDDLHTEVNQKLKPNERQLYYDKVQEIQAIINQNTGAFLGNSKDAKEVANIKNGLKSLEMFLKVLMEKHKMFGAKEEAELL